MTRRPYQPEIERLLTPGEVADMFRVDSRTVTRWAREGKIPSVQTLGGHRRYPEAAIRALLDGSETRRQTVRDHTGTDTP